MTYPYISGRNNVIKIIEQLHNKFPPSIDIDIIKKFMIAPKAERHIINMLKFLNLIDADGNAVSESEDVFLKFGDDFKTGLSKIIEKAYHKLFSIYGEDAWLLSDEKLLTFFREEDKGAVRSAKDKVKTFKTLAEICGKIEAKETAQAKSSAPTKINKPKQDKPKINAPKSAPITTPITTPTEQAHLKPSGDFALSVRIEVNLPAGGTKQNYDDIFKSIRENLINE